MYSKQLTRNQEKLLEKCKKQYMIGRLRNDNPFHITKYGDVKFYVDTLCDEPKAILDMKVFMEQKEEYIGLDKFQTATLLPIGYEIGGYNVQEKLNQMSNYLENKLIIFTPQFTQNNDGKWFKNVTIKSIVNDYIEHYKVLHTVPKINIEPSRFEQILRKKEYFDLFEYNAELYDIPEIILCGNYAYRLIEQNLNDNLVEVSDENKERWKCIHYDKIVKVNLSKIETKNDIIRASDNISFITDTLKQQILLSNVYSNLEETSIRKDSINREFMFLEGLKQLTINKGLHYEYSDLINFHTSLKTTPLTILAGMSGTGKTQLAYNYAKMLDLSEDNDTLLFMPISPSYTEPNDVLGYLNSMNGSYIPSETGFVHFLQHASENNEQMHLVIFDEMNLSQVEYWFSPFISILEKEADERYLKLYDEDAPCSNKDIYPHRIKIGENILFVGTVNIDDTTKDFSDRLLDRTFVINLQKVNFTNFYQELLKSKDTINDISASKCEDVSEFMQWNKSDSRNYISAFHGYEKELEFLDKLDSLIQEHIPNGGISYRVLKNIGNYINNIPLNLDKSMIISRKEVFDTIVNQTVMTKIRGTETQLNTLIGIMHPNTNNVESSKLIALLDEYNEISDFEKVRKNIKKKAEDLRINGYTN